MTDVVGRYRVHVERLARAVLETAGETDAPVRRAVEMRCAAFGGRTAEPASEAVPASLDRYVERVALHAYTVVDADIEALKAVAYSEDAIFEITLSAAFGAARGRLERGMGALRGSRS